MRVTLSSLDGTTSIEASTIHDRPRLGLWLTGIEGWRGRPALRTESAERPNADGDWTSRFKRLASRVVTLSIAADCPDSVTAAMLIDRINGMDGQLRLTVEDAIGLRRAECYLADSFEPTMLPSERRFTGDIILQCDDPLKYGPEMTFTAFSNKLTVENDGNAPTLPKVTVTGNPTMLSLTLGNHRVTWHGDGSEEQVDIDFRDMAPTSGTMGTGDAFEIPPNGTSVIDVDVTPDTCTTIMTVTPAYR